MPLDDEGTAAPGKWAECPHCGVQNKILHPRTEGADGSQYDGTDYILCDCGEEECRARKVAVGIGGRLLIGLTEATQANREEWRTWNAIHLPPMSYKELRDSVRCEDHEDDEETLFGSYDRAALTEILGSQENLFDEDAS